MDAYALSIKHVTYPLWVLKNGSARLRYLAELERVVRDAQTQEAAQPSARSGLAPG